MRDDIPRVPGIGLIFDGCKVAVFVACVLSLACRASGALEWTDQSLLVGILIWGLAIFLGASYTWRRHRRQFLYDAPHGFPVILKEEANGEGPAGATGTDDANGEGVPETTHSPVPSEMTAMPHRRRENREYT